jgi:diguanylate cyclase (GGDEF)-like protein
MPIDDFNFGEEIHSGGQVPTSDFSGRKVLVIEDEPGIRGVIRQILTLKGYVVTVAPDGPEGLQRAASENPDLILLDVMMPGMTGFEVCRGLREDMATAMTPVIMLTVKSRTQDRIRGMESGADDYIVKPFDADELLVRIEAALRRKERDLYASPLTRLPGNISIETEIKRRIALEQPLAVVALDIDHFKAYNDEYGYQKGDDIISIVSLLIVRAVREKGHRGDFVGHIGGDDFLVITRPDTVDAVAAQVIGDFDLTIPEHYSPDSRRRGYIEGLDRHGRVERFPIMTISVASVTNERQTIEHPAKVAEVLAELKKAAKAVPGSIHIKDRRREPGSARRLPVESESSLPADPGGGAPGAGR